MKSYTLDRIIDRTNIIPSLLCSCVTPDETLQEWCEERTVALYNHNQRWRKAMHSKDPRGYLLAFYRHWLTGKI